ncbi:MAG: hypothetical protein CMH48_08825 [Muricauda sp.]|nr:carboxypeptidase-like regulatory domain-containing protein [Allomuricauda sp.]MAU26072.1 hypothetical protein [Allomuricauda sp.]MBC30937.1 hypothetical protein [Allomuricauda sp.]|tara:strand:+ start:103096 stop:104958 length:1863 start_codon:yes stop_codon:yes gene_type:complete
MKKLLYLFLFIGLFGLAQENERKISGKVTDGRSPVSNVSVSIEDKGTKAFTDQDGRYEIMASTGDVIQYSYTGLKTIRIKVEDVTRILNPIMVPDVTELEEVVVKGSNRKSQRELELEYPVNLNIIRTAYGYLNAETAPGNIRFMNEEDINPVSLCILDLLRNRFAGVRVQGSCLGAFGPGAGIGTQVTNIEAQNTNDPGVVGRANAAGGVQSSLNNGRVFIRGTNSLFNPRSAIFDVDGQIFNEPPIWLDVKNIKRLAILNNFATTTMYGNAGAGGVIVINTISASPKSDKIHDMARLRNNYVTGPALSQTEVLENGATYLKKLYASGDLESAKKVYDEYSKMYASSPYFHIDAQHYFQERWGATEYADGIIESKFYLFDKNPVLFKALAYNYEAQGQFKKAHEFYKKVMTLRPDYGQSYMDLANSFRNLRMPKEAATIYNRYSYLVEEDMMRADSTGFLTIINREYNNLLMLNKNAIVDADKAKDLFVEQEDFEGTRLVFEWNDGEAEFDLQFVNPENQHFTLKHTLADNADIIEKEKNQGYSCTEYLIDGSLPGTWKVNINYHGNKSLTPTYLKATIYHDYGTFAQRKEVKTFKLSLKGVNQELFQLVKSSKITSRL